MNNAEILRNAPQIVAACLKKGLCKMPTYGDTEKAIEKAKSKRPTPHQWPSGWGQAAIPSVEVRRPKFASTSRG